MYVFLKVYTKTIWATVWTIPCPKLNKTSQTSSGNFNFFVISPQLTYRSRTMTLQHLGQLSNFPGSFRRSLCSLPWVLSGGDNLDRSSEHNTTSWDTSGSPERSRSLKWIRTWLQELRWNLPCTSHPLHLFCFLTQRVFSLQLIYTFYKYSKR